jgi:uncharacterized CHY-type Zn-finger protein
MMYNCPKCKKSLDEHFDISNTDNPRLPQDGDIILCACCAAVLTIDNKEIRFATTTEVFDLPDGDKININMALREIRAHMMAN